MWVRLASLGGRVRLSWSILQGFLKVEAWCFFFLIYVCWIGETLQCLLLLGDSLCAWLVESGLVSGFLCVFLYRQVCFPFMFGCLRGTGSGVSDLQFSGVRTFARLSEGIECKCLFVFVC